MKTILKACVVLVLSAVVCLLLARHIYKVDYIDQIRAECAKYGTDPHMVLAIIKAESDFNPAAVSEKNAVGLMQLTEETAAWCAGQLGIAEFNASDLYNPVTNIKFGVYYYQYLLEHYGQDAQLALAAYNAGMGNIDKWLSNTEYSKDGATLHSIPYPETERYLTKVNNHYKIYKFLYKTL